MPESGTSTSADWSGRARESLEVAATIKPFLQLDRMGALAGVLAIAVAWPLGLRSNLLLLTAGSIVVLVALLSVAIVAIDRNQVTMALALATVGNWLVAVNVAWTVPQLWPVMIMTVLMPVVLAAPFVRTRLLFLLLAGTAIAISLVAAAGLLNDDGGAVADLADERELLLVICAAVVHTVPIALIVRNNNGLLQSRLRSLADLNVELRSSEQQLEESRRRVVEAGDVERRRIERDLHDGAQQRLVSLGVRLRLLDALTGPDHELNDNVLLLIDEADGAIEELRLLAHGIYPPLLESGGLGPALNVAVRRSTLRVATDLDDTGRFDPQRERALYFVALEALTNAAKYAPESSVTMTLGASTASLTLEVRDDGPGFDLGDVGVRHGTDNMSDRLASVGGHLDIVSSPGNGTVVTATVPREVSPDQHEQLA